MGLQFGGPDKTNWWNRFNRRIGKEPVLLDSTLTARSAEGMKIYLNGKGFLDASTAFRVDTSGKKAKVTYLARQGEPYRIGSIRYDFRDRSLQSIIFSDTISTLLHTGDIFDANTLDDERVRITSFLKNRGYYNFSINNISYVADSTAGNRTVNLTMVVKRYMAGYTAEGEATLDDNRIYRIRNIYIYPDYNPSAAVSDSLYESRLDTLDYKGLKIVYDTRSKVRAEILRRTISLYPNYLYNADEVKRTYENIMRLDYYKSASILFSEAEGDTLLRDNRITYIGQSQDSTGIGEASYGTEHYLNCTIFCTPALRQDTRWNSKNHVGRLFRNRRHGGLPEPQPVPRRRTVRHQGARRLRIHASNRSATRSIRRIDIVFVSRFITPLRIDRYNRAFNPRTKVVSYSVQRRPYYIVRWPAASGAIRGATAKQHLRPAAGGHQRGETAADRHGFPRTIAESPPAEQLRIAADRRTVRLVYLQQPEDQHRTQFAGRFNFETNGNLIDGLSHLFAVRRGRVLQTVRYPVRPVFPVRSEPGAKIRFGAENQSRISLLRRMGIRLRQFDIHPVQRLFYCGGSNSMRGWLARTLGPGNEVRWVSDYPTQLGNFKLETNLEARFPVWGILQGALFFDVGNIWFLGQGGYGEESQFKIDRFYKQLGFNTGLGARFDFSFFVFRIDWGIKLHNPNEAAGQRWIQNFRMQNTTLNFGVGYPF
ncbi:MAG: BamA/TamA family outer membrane protein [Alistipes sp.]